MVKLYRRASFIWFVHMYLLNVYPLSLLCLKGKYYKNLMSVRVGQKTPS